MQPVRLVRGARRSAASTDPNLTLFGSNYQDVFAFLVLIAVLSSGPRGCWASASPTAPESRHVPRREEEPAARLGGLRARRRRARGAAASRWSCSPRATFWVRITNIAILYCFLALGLNIVVGFAGLLDLGYIAFYAVGAYVYALLASPHFNLHLPFWIILPIGASVACFFGVLLGAPTLKLRGDYLAIVTLGFGEIIRIFLNNLSQPVNITNGAAGHRGHRPVHAGRRQLRSADDGSATFALSGSVKYYYLLLVILLVVIVINLRLQNSRIGRAWEAIREDEIAARAMGINTRNMKLLAFAMGASFGGIAGGMFSAIQGFISPESFVLVESIMVLSMVVLGGMGNICGRDPGRDPALVRARTAARHRRARRRKHCSGEC